MPTIILVMACGGCGAPVPDESANLQSPSTAPASRVDKGDTPRLLPVGDTAMQEKKIDGDSTGTAPVNRSEDLHAVTISSIPRSVTTDLASPEARTRLRALEHWEQKDSKVPLDAVFEAMEDEDEVVSAKAEAIVEQRWAAEQEKERR